MAEPTIRISIPKTARPGETIRIKALISHVMETGRRSDGKGGVVPRDILTGFRCGFDGEPVLSCALSTGIAANPYLEFDVTVSRSGTFVFSWQDEHGQTYSRKQPIEVRA